MKRPMDKIFAKRKSAVSEIFCEKTAPQAKCAAGKIFLSES